MTGACARYNPTESLSDSNGAVAACRLGECSEGSSTQPRLDRLECLATEKQVGYGGELSEHFVAPARDQRVLDVLRS